MSAAVLCLAAALLAAGAAPDDRGEAVRLARAGAHREALALFSDQARRDPSDLEARTWVAQLLVWTGRPVEAERAFRDVLASDPRAVDALLGLGLLVQRRGHAGEALALLTRAEALDPARPDTLAALGRAHRLAGRTDAAVSYFERASRLAPADRDIRRGLELTRAQHDHRVDAAFVHETRRAGGDPAAMGSIDLDLRAGRGLRVRVHQQVQRKFDLTESRTGAGLEWRAGAATRMRAEASVAPGAVVLPRAAGGIEIERSTRYGDVAGAVRLARFETARVWVAAPGVTVPAGERVLISGRYFLALTSFDQLGESVVNHSAALSVRTRVADRLWLGGSYARGNESFETLTVERLGRFRADTVGASARAGLVGGASLHAGVEYQHADARGLWRVTTGLSRRF